MIYLNSAATSFHKPPEVKEAVISALTEYGSAARGANASSFGPSRMLTGLREELAELFGFSHPERVIFTMNATQALNTVIFGLFKSGDRIISTDLEHNSVLRPLYRLQKEDVTVDFLKADSEGFISMAELETLACDDRPFRAIICTHASNLTGMMINLSRFAKIAHEHGALFIVDASQTAGACPIDMEKTGIDILCFTGHKSLMGPQGTGGLLVRPGIDIRPLITGGTGVLSFEPEQPEEYPEHLEAGTSNSHGLAGLLASVEFIKSVGVENIEKKEAELTERFMRGAEAIPGVTIYGTHDLRRYADAADVTDTLDAADTSDASETADNSDASETADNSDVTDATDNVMPYVCHAPIVSLNMAGISSAELADVLSEQYGIQVRAGGHCAPRMHRALGTEKLGSVRFSFGYYTTEEEIDAALEALKEIGEAL